MERGLLYQLAGLGLSLALPSVGPATSEFPTT